MNNIDQIIDNASSENEAISEISKVARSIHGDAVIDNLIDIAPSEKLAKEAIVRFARMSKTPTAPKQNPVEKFAFEAMESLTPLAKAVSHVATPVTESLRGPFQYIAQNVGDNTSQTPPIDPLAELQDPTGAPSDRAGLGTLLTDISNSVGIKQQPLLNVDIENFPQTSGAINYLSNPAELTGAILEGMVGTKNFKMPGVKDIGAGARIGSVAEDVMAPVRASGLSKVASEFYPSKVMDPLKSRLNRREMIKNYVTQAARDRGLLDDIMASGQFEYMVDMLENNPDLIQPFNQKSALDELEGPIASGINPETNRMSYKRAPEQGQLGKLAAQQSSIIDEIPNKYNVNREDFLQSAFNELPGNLDEGQRSSAMKLIQDSVSPIERDQSKLQRVQKSMDLRDQIINTADEFGNEPSVMQNSLPNERKISLQNQIQTLMNDLMEIDDPGVQTVDDYNEFIYNLNQAEAGPFLNQQRKTGNVYIDQTSPFVDPRDVAARTQAGKALESAASQGLEMPMSELPGLSQELYQDTNRGISTRRNYRDLITGSRSSKENLGRLVPQGDIERGAISKTLGLGDEYLVPTGHKIADYLSRQGIQYGNGLASIAPISIQAYKIPRNSQRIMQEKGNVIAKIGKEMGPQFASDLEMIDDADAVKLFLRNVELTRPDLFEKDPYARMDGVIDHPTLKQKALEDTLNNRQVSVFDRANTVEDLLLHNRLLS